MGAEYNLTNMIHVGKNKLSRVDLDQCYDYTEYNKTFQYGKENINIAGVRDLLISLNNESEKYKADIAAITAATRETEESKYLLWGKWYKAKQISLYVLVGIALLWVIARVVCYFMNIPADMNSVLHRLGSLARMVLLVFLVLKAGESTCRKSYNNYTDIIRKEIGHKNLFFANVAREYYQKVDNLYLGSLDPAHREMVLMRREQTEHNKEMMRMEKERVRKEDERLAEQRRARKAQEDLLAIERERERRNGF